LTRPGIALAAAIRSAALRNGLSLVVTSPHSTVATSDTGSKSFRMSHVRFECRLGSIVMMLSLKPPIVYPSGGAFATCSVPISPAAPGWFSMTICWPRFCDIFCARIRAALSTALAAASGTIIRIGLLG
jgi:hypothetical protein